MRFLTLGECVAPFQTPDGRLPLYYVYGYSIRYELWRDPGAIGRYPHSVGKFDIYSAQLTMMRLQGSVCL